MTLRSARAAHGRRPSLSQLAMGVVSHGYGGLGGVSDGGDGWQACRSRQGDIGHMSGDYRALTEC